MAGVTDCMLMFILLMMLFLIWYVLSVHHLLLLCIFFDCLDSECDDRFCWKTLQKSYLQKVLADNPGLPCFLFGHSTGGAIVLKVSCASKEWCGYGYCMLCF